MAYEEHMLIVGGKNRQLSTFDMFCLLELDKEWGLFISARNFAIKQLKSSSLKEFIMLKITSMIELRVIILPILLDISKNNKAKQLCSQFIDKVFQVTELSYSITDQISSSLDPLKKELEEFIKSKKVKHVDHASLEQLAAKIASVDSSEIDPSDIYSLVHNSPEVMLEAYSKMINEVKIKTSPVPFGSQKHQFDMYHELYAAKRINNLPVKSLQDDLITKIALAEKSKLIKVMYSWQDHNDTQAFTPAIITDAVKHVYPSVTSAVNQAIANAGVPVSLLMHCMLLSAELTASLSSLSELHRHIHEDLPVEKKVELRDSIAYGVKTSRLIDSKSICLVITHGAEVLLKKVVECGNDPTDEELRNDLALEDELSQCLKKYYPKVITVDCSNIFGIKVAQKIKEEVAKFTKMQSNVAAPIYFTKKCIISERRAYYLDNKTKTNTVADFMYLITYALACSGQDKLLESLKLRFSTKDFPYLINDCVVF